MLLSDSTHFVNGRSMTEDYPDGSEQMMVGMGCFWGVESGEKSRRLLQSRPDRGVVSGADKSERLGPLHHRRHGR